MAADSKHPQYKKRAGQWERCRDCYDGIDAIRAKTTLYLPKLSRYQKPEDYDAYLNRAVYYPAFPRAVEALVGAAMREAPTVEAPPRVLEELKDVDGLGTSVETVIGQVVRELLIGSRMEIAQDVTGTRCLWTLYRAEDFLTWLFAVRDGRPYLTRAVVVQKGYEADEKTDEIRETEIYRELTQDSQGRTFLQRYRRVAGGKFEKVGGKVALLTPAQQPLSRVPLTVADLPTISGRPYSPPKPVLLDMADMALSHFRTSADLEHGAHYVALPTPYVATEADAPRKTLRLGAGAVWWLPKTAKVAYLEVSGQGFNALENIMARKARQIMAIGGRAVSEPVRHAETALAAQIKDQEDHSLMSVVIGTAERAVERAIALHMEWLGIPGAEPRVTINGDWRQAMAQLGQPPQPGNGSGEDDE